MNRNIGRPHLTAVILLLCLLLGLSAAAVGAENATEPPSVAEAAAEEEESAAEELTETPPEEEAAEEPAEETSEEIPEESAQEANEELTEEASEEPPEEAGPVSEEPAAAPAADREPVQLEFPVRIGLYWGDDALEGANLLNYIGSGYDLGYFDEEQRFVPLLSTDETAISMLKDWSLYYDGSQYGSDVPDGWKVRVGCYHIRLGVCEDYASAAALAAAYDDGYTAMMNGRWCAYAGSYISQAAAEEAAAARGIEGTAMTASNRCVTVVVTGTDRVIFQYDDGDETALGVMPRPAEEGERPVTWFRGSRYYGGFRYTRIGGGSLTVVNILPMEDYVCGVVPYEMSPSWPIEALKAQAVSARTYAASHLGNHRSYGFDLCNGVCCQAYLGVNVNAADCEAAVRDTAGVFMTYEGDYAETYYHSCDGGATEASENVFYDAIPYLRGVIDPYESHVRTGYEDWSFVYTTDEITSILQMKGYNCAKIVSVTPTYTALGNILSLKFTDSKGVAWSFSRSRAGSILYSQTYGKYTYSQRFTITDADGSELTQLCINEPGCPVSETEGFCAIDGSGQIQSIGGGSVAVVTGKGTETLSLGGGAEIRAERYLVSGSGWGHNVGMSQYGAKAMAELGFSYRDILEFYFNGVEIG